MKPITEEWADLVDDVENGLIQNPFRQTKPVKPMKDSYAPLAVALFLLIAAVVAVCAPFILWYLRENL